MVLLISILPRVSMAQESSLNVLDMYQPESPVNCRFAVLDGEPFLIYAVMDFRMPVTDSLWIQYSWTLNGNTFGDSTLIKPQDSQKVLNWSIDGDEIPTKVTITFIWQARQWIFQEHFPMSAFHPSGGISLWQPPLPLVAPFVHQGDNVMIRHNLSDSIYVFYYSHDFDPARPPMTIRPGNSNAALSIDSVFTVTANSIFAPEKEGLYFFQADSSTTMGVSLLVTDEHFPQPKKITDLTEPLIYITTKREYETLAQDFSSKQALDKFWLATVGSPEKARVAIKNFYQNIQEANSLFSSYKEGWKTDKGMIYAILGRPLTVTKQIDSEIWGYLDIGGEEINFEFKKVRNIFSNNHYELYRDKSYDRSWFRAIDRWREGLAP